MIKIQKNTMSKIEKIEHTVKIEVQLRKGENLLERKCHVNLQLKGFWNFTTLKSNRKINDQCLY